jgi:hypothetical protein
MSGSDVADLIRFSSLAIIVFMLANKVFSAQYLAWLCPLLPLIIGEQRYKVATLFVVAGVLTQYIYPYDYNSFELGEALPVFVLFVRNILLIIAAVLMALPRRYQIPGSNALRSGG